ncbi:hypothetical protein MVEN_00613000 [Mycena venus]|uniref:Uncharacterized protein n=1 Tax=Mycena venus TaxID=2733690 RepID=A0A8H6YP73_9AGAR|nr:hypothetical protein MVEN_00613000 [Mycena venus]
MRTQYTANAARRPVVSTVVPTELSDILTSWRSGDSDSDHSSRLGKNLIAYQLKCYHKYISAPPAIATHAHFPSLVDLAAQKLPLAADALDGIPDVLLSRHIWRWHAISYPMLRGALTRLSTDPGEPAMKRQKTASGEVAERKEQKDDIDEWILAHEKYLGDSERLGKEWQHGLITLKDDDCDAIFPTSSNTSHARTITREASLPGYKVLDGRRSLAVDIQPSVAAFRRVFDRMSDGLLKNLNWNNIIVAGGIVLGALLSVAGAGAGEQWKASDIDIYIYGLTPAQANEKLHELFATFKTNLPARSPALIVRNSKTITFYSRYPLRRIQIVLKLVRSPRAVLLNFDLDICAMCWDGNEFWMLPRAARALETGFNVFTMNMIQGHYLSERRATQEQRVFKYADRGYGLRILPSYISSLEESKSKLQDISRDEVLFGVDMEKIATASREWTRTVVEERVGSYDSAAPKRIVAHGDLDNKHQLSSEPQGRSCLTGFSLFMRHVALWEMEKAGEIKINREHWASTDYGDYPESVLTYDDTPSYSWGEGFNITDFKRQIKQFNLRQITDWIRYPYDEDFFDTHGLDGEGNEFKSAARLTYATSIETILDRGHDIVMPVLVPRNLAAYINHLVGEAQQAAGLEVQNILTPAVKRNKDLIVAPDSTDSEDGLYMWRIGNEMMWQQLDRKIDEAFEVLYAFYRINDRPHSDWKPLRLVTQLSKRAIRSSVEDEFDAFARWIGRQPIFVDRFYASGVELEHIEGQEEQYTAEDN